MGECGTRKKCRCHAVVVGAGPAGLTAAAELIQKSVRVTILEKDEHYVGGLSRTIRYKGFRFDIGGHRFFSKNSEIVNWWMIRMPEGFLRVKRRSRILYNGKFFDYPLRAPNTLRGLGFILGVKCVVSYLYAWLSPVTPEKTFEDWVCNRFGRTLFQVFFKTYTEKVWGMECAKISADWAAQRIKGLSLKRVILDALGWKYRKGAVKTLANEFNYPRLGPGMLWEKTRDDIIQNGVIFKMGRDVVEIERNANSITKIKTRNAVGKEEDWLADHFIVSMPLQETILKMRPRVPEDVEDAARKLRYRGFITVALIVQRQDIFADHWIYVHDPDVKVGRIQNFKNWSAEMVPDSKFTCLGLEYFCDFGDEIWKLTDDSMIGLAKSELAKLRLGIHPDDVADGCVVRIDKAYPIYDKLYQQNLRIIRQELSKIINLQVIGRNGMHKYNNQDHSMLTGILAAKNIYAKKYDLWCVNTDAEYLEEKRTGSGRMMPQQLDG